jgi:glutamine---fructose-6-phosphate transaminase (isomerizing)
VKGIKYMCGIAGYVGDRESADVLVDALSKLEYRGYDSAGIAVFDHGNTYLLINSRWIEYT